MTFLKVLEALAESDKSWEDAAQHTRHHGAKTMHNIKSIYIKEIEASANQNKIVKYRSHAKNSFLPDES
ncbi:Conserved hypothetical protein [Herminiimonas arsenicoxydans]|uniref:Uncharacterized protein n=1 Tax=Herminiimonas arsenicoxydans TaxID=204773 RepID=A4G817_HERAR|nr:Conserved hypothetical protein [Herminiimonas arsenicoxydans]